MKLNLMRDYLPLFFRNFIGFGSALFAVIYILDGKVSYILVVGTALLFSFSQTYNAVKSRRANL